MRVGRGLNPTAASCQQGGPVAPGPDAEGRAGPPRREDSPFSLHAGPADTGLLQPSQPPSEKGTGTGATPIAQTGSLRHREVHAPHGHSASKLRARTHPRRLGVLVHRSVTVFSTIDGMLHALPKSQVPTKT